MNFKSINSLKNLKGLFQFKCYDSKGRLKWCDFVFNDIMDEAITDMLGVYFSGDSVNLNWYIGLKGSNEAVNKAWTSANINNGFTEFTDYDEATRVQWQEAGASSKIITNSANPAEFTINSSGSVYGAFLVSIATKGGQTGILWCVSNVAVARVVVDDDVINVTYTITGQDV
ncbi:MAG: hypothetical protein RBR32_01680 [Bacteroidales bacterium]|nr:hypothetical protein [Bacteroidales bacterium]